MLRLDGDDASTLESMKEDGGMWTRWFDRGDGVGTGEFETVFWMRRDDDA